MGYEEFKNDTLGLRDHLAIDRTAMANERTFLAYARTAIMLAATAITLFKLFPDSQIAFGSAVGLTPAAIIVAAVGIRRYFVLSRGLKAMR